MADLYTNQVHLKRLLAGQATAAFTRAPEDVLKMFDPAFMIGGNGGMGGLNEDEHGRIQCPVRGCGTWHNFIASHFTKRHGEIGGASAIRAALGMPKKQILLSASRRTNTKPRSRVGSFQRGSTAHLARNANRSARSEHNSMAARNWADTCPAQLQERIEACARKVGRSPTQGEFISEYGESAKAAIYVLFGSWSAAKATCSLAVYAKGDRSDLGSRRDNGRLGSGRRISIAQMVESLRAWIDVHGDLPSSRDCSDPSRAPRIPGFECVLRVFGVDNWAAAMRSAGEHLSIRSERYGFDFTRKTA